MKKGKGIVGTTIVTIILTFVLSLMGPYYKVVSAADETLMKFSINGGAGGEFKAGSSVEITVDLSNLTNFYAGSVDYAYDNTLLEVSSIEVNPKIKEYNIYEAYNDVAKDGNIARYGFSIMGAKNGISGATRFITIKGKVKKDGNLSVEQKDVSSQLVQKVDDTMKEIDKVEFDNGKERYSIINEKGSDGSTLTQKAELIGPSQPSDNKVQASTNGTSNDVNKGETAENSNNPEGNSNNENKDQTAEASDSLEKSFDENASDNNSDVDNSGNTSSDEKDSNNYIYLSLALGTIVIAAGGIVVYKKRNKKESNSI